MRRPSRAPFESRPAALLNTLKVVGNQPKVQLESVTGVTATQSERCGSQAVRRTPLQYATCERSPSNAKVAERAIALVGLGPACLPCEVVLTSLVSDELAVSRLAWPIVALPADRDKPKASTRSTTRSASPVGRVARSTPRPVTAAPTLL
jgi:hypothetical protein